MKVFLEQWPDISLWFLELAIKPVIIVLLAYLWTFLLRRKSAALRHHIWVLALLGVLLVPTVGYWLPKWHILPEWNTSQLEILADTLSAPPSVTAVTDNKNHTSQAPQEEHLVSSSALPSETTVDTQKVLQTSTAVSPASQTGFSIWILLYGIIGFLVILPMMWGFSHAYIVLPSSADSWSSERRQMVLQHELAHIQRHDWLMQAFARIMCAVYWFHPLVWFAAHQLKSEAERACDDCVLTTTKPSAYATELLEMMQILTIPRWRQQAAVSMARRSALEVRLRAILNPRYSRKGLTRFPMLFSIIIAGSLIAILALCQLEYTSRTPNPTQSPSMFSETSIPSETLAAEGKSNEEPASRPTRKGVQEIDVTNVPAVVVNTFPVSGDVQVDPNITEIRVTFSKYMNTGGWSWVQSSEESFLEGTGKIHYQEDARTCVYPVKLKADQNYVIWLNTARFENFRDEEGRPALPYMLAFRTGPAVSQ